MFQLKVACQIFVDIFYLFWFLILSRKKEILTPNKKHSQSVVHMYIYATENAHVSWKSNFQESIKLGI